MIQTDGITGASNEVSFAVCLGDDNELWNLSLCPDDRVVMSRITVYCSSPFSVPSCLMHFALVILL